jgi:hypothetical protein
MPRFEPGFIQRRWKHLLVPAVFVAYGLGGGCYAQRLPAAPSPAAAELLAQGPLPYRVVVEPWDSAAAARHRVNPEAYAAGTFHWLQSSGAFASVRMGAPGDTAADFLASSTGAYCNTAVIPMFTILSLGIIPTTFTDTDCEGAVLRPLHPGAGAADSVVIGSELSGRVVMGWLAVPVGALPGWTHGDARDHQRTRALARLAVLQHRSRLVALAGGATAR